jgi:hypothetical protein
MKVLKMPQQGPWRKITHHVWVRGPWAIEKDDSTSPPVFYVYRDGKQLSEAGSLQWAKREPERLEREAARRHKETRT